MTVLTKTQAPSSMTTPRMFTGTWRMTAAGAKQLRRSKDVLAGHLLMPMAFLAIIALFRNLTFELPGQSISFIDLLVTGLGVLMIAIAGGHVFLANIATYKATGVTKRISVTPVSPASFMLGEIVPRVVYALVMIVAFFAVGAALGADIQLTARLIGLLPVALLATGFALSLAFFIAGITKNPANANAVDTFTMFPLFMFTGAFFPLEAFPGWIESAVQFIPYTGLIVATRGITLRAEPLTDFGPEMAIGLSWLLVMFALAARAYRFIK
jgi:ABC-2 type transport system permease protein